MVSGSVFPDELRRSAHAVGNGELFWPLSVAADAARALASAGHAVRGGEIYVGRGRAWGNIEFEWVTEPSRREGEPWSAYVDRALRQALDALSEAQQTLPAEAEALGSAREPMCFFPHGAPEAPGSWPRR